jgi:hypothetical protein
MDTEVFVYTGRQGGDNVPQDVVRVRIDPSVMSIPARAFSNSTKLAEVELCEGLVEIGDLAFNGCDHSITKIIIPISLRRINNDAFHYSLRCPIRLRDGIESIGHAAFSGCIFTNFRVPPLITVIPEYMLCNCTSLFSVEIPLTITEIGSGAFWYCHYLRNVAFPPNADVDDDILGGATDLLQLFGSIILQQLKHRFDELPVHSTVYYQSYNQGVLQRLITSGNELDPTGNQQDCLGMTPLHILVCSSVHDMEIYRVIVAKYSANLITADAWGALPLLYAIWGDAPIEIINFLIDSYQSLYQDHEFDWTDMVITLGRANAPVGVIQNLLYVHRTLSPGYNIDWDQVLVELARATTRTEPFASPATFCFLTRCSIAARVSAIGVKHFRDDMADDWTVNIDYNFDREMWRIETLTKLEYYESEYQKLKESTSLLELVLWKMNIDASSTDNDVAMGDNNRLECRTNCGADVVIENVWPYLLPSDFVRSYVPQRGGQ